MTARKTTTKPVPAPATAPATTITEVDTRQVFPGPNDRTVFDPTALAELAANIAEHGLIQPITVRLFAPDPNCAFGGNPIGGLAQFQIVAGERRFRACADILKWETIPAIVKDISDEQAAAIMLSENVSRQDIDPIDEANAYASRMKLYGWTVAQCAAAAGVSEIRVQFRLKLLSLRTDVQGLVKTGNLQLGYAQVLASSDLDNNRQMMALAALRDNPNPNPSWFRRTTSDLLGQQAQDKMLDVTPIFGGDLEQMVTWTPIVQPPHPADLDAAPTHTGADARERLGSQASFWTEAAEAWERLGRSFKRQECLAAAQALQIAMTLV